MSNQTPPRHQEADDMPESVPARPTQAAVCSTVRPVSLAAGVVPSAAPLQQPSAAAPASLIPPSTATLQIHSTSTTSTTPDCGVSNSELGPQNTGQQLGQGKAHRKTTSISSNPASSTSSSPKRGAGSFRNLYSFSPPARTTRRQAKDSDDFEFQLLPGSEWEAVDIVKARKAREESEKEAKAQKAKEKQANPKAQSHRQLYSETGEASMSRNRPRGPPTRDNGLAANEEVEMCDRIRQDILKAQEKNRQQIAVNQQLVALKDKIAKAGRKATINELEQMENYYRQMNKLSEEERAILNDEPHDVIKNLEILKALRLASNEASQAQGQAAHPSKPRKKKAEIETPVSDSPATSAPGVSDKLHRLKSSTQRSTSVSSSQAREAVSVKSEDGGEGTKGTAAEKSGHLFVGAEVVFKHNKKQQGVEGEGIQCIIKSIAGEGHKKRYDVQDPEPNENGEEGAVYKTTAASLIPIPQMGSSLPSFSVGKQVLARYPDTTTFYRAEVMGSKKDVYRLKFEGEEDDKEMDVDRRFVLDIPGK